MSNNTSNFLVTIENLLSWYYCNLSRNLWIELLLFKRPYRKSQEAKSKTLSKTMGLGDKIGRDLLERSQK